MWAGGEGADSWFSMRAGFAEDLEKPTLYLELPPSSVTSRVPGDCRAVGLRQGGVWADALGTGQRGCEGCSIHQKAVSCQLAGLVALGKSAMAQQ